MLSDKIIRLGPLTNQGYIIKVDDRESELLAKNDPGSVREVVVLLETSPCQEVDGTCSQKPLFWGCKNMFFKK